MIAETGEEGEKNTDSALTGDIRSEKKKGTAMVYFKARAYVGGRPMALLKLCRVGLYSAFKL